MAGSNIERSLLPGTYSPSRIRVFLFGFLLFSGLCTGLASSGPAQSHGFFHFGQNRFFTNNYTHQSFGPRISRRRSSRLRCTDARLEHPTLTHHPAHQGMRYVAKALATTNIALLSTFSKSLAFSWNWCLSSFCATSRKSTTARKHSSWAAACAVA